LTGDDKLPLPGLLALAAAAFVTLTTEIIPAGILPSIANGLKVSESAAGQFITAYAVGALVAAIPVMTLTQGMRRRRLLLLAIGGFAAVNMVTALSNVYAISLMARFFAGACGGIVWSLLAGYAARMSPSSLEGRAIAVSGSGATIALVLGTPLGASLGRVIGWQGPFGLIAAIALSLIVWVIAAVPDFPGQPQEHRPKLEGVLLKTGVRSVLFVVMSFVCAHNILYVYVTPFLERSALSNSVDRILFAFGGGAIAALWFVGATVDRHPRILAVASVTGFAFAALLFSLWGSVASIVYFSVVIWGMAFGGFATITQSALSRFAGSSVDLAQSMFTTCWNVAVASGGAAGGILLDRLGSASFAWVVLGILALSFTGVVFPMNSAWRHLSTHTPASRR